MEFTWMLQALQAEARMKKWGSTPSEWRRFDWNIGEASFDFSMKNSFFLKETFRKMYNLWTETSKFDLALQIGLGMKWARRNATQKAYDLILHNKVKVT